jgi:hypothetical protein
MAKKPSKTPATAAEVTRDLITKRKQAESDLADHQARTDRLVADLRASFPEHSPAARVVESVLQKFDPRLRSSAPPTKPFEAREPVAGASVLCADGGTVPPEHRPLARGTVLG